MMRALRRKKNRIVPAKTTDKIVDDNASNNSKIKENVRLCGS